MPTNLPISDTYRGPLRAALVVSALVTILSLLVLDGGETARLSGIGLLVSWGWVLTGMWLRPRTPTACDLWLIRRGCLPIIIGFQVAVHLVWYWRGLH
jgi:hypothetical protein